MTFRQAHLADIGQMVEIRFFVTENLLSNAGPGYGSRLRRLPHAAWQRLGR
ncbi:MAG: hypothetical protein ACRYFX_06505 [Janthinobacterium lividum]